MLSSFSNNNNSYLNSSVTSSSDLQLDPSSFALSSEDAQMSSPTSNLFNLRNSNFLSQKSDSSQLNTNHLMTDNPEPSSPTFDMNVPDTDRLINDPPENQNKHTSATELTSPLAAQPKKRARRTWTPKEDSMLRTLVAEWGDQRGKNSRWDKISESMEGRTSKDCRKRWFHSLDPTLKRGRWTSDEDRILIEAYESYGPAWNRIAQLISGRTDDQCSKRYNDVLDPNVQDRLRPWTDKEDLLLMEMFQLHGTQWKIIASKMDGRTGLTCRNRWRKLAATSTSTSTSSSASNKSKRSGSDSRPADNFVKRPNSKSSSRKNSWSNNLTAQHGVTNTNSLTPETTSDHSSNKSSPQLPAENATVSLMDGFNDNRTMGLISVDNNELPVSTSPSIQKYGIVSGDQHTPNRLVHEGIANNSLLNHNSQLDHISQYKVSHPQRQQLNNININGSLLDGLLCETENPNLFTSISNDSDSVERNSANITTYNPTNDNQLNQEHRNYENVATSEKAHLTHANAMKSSHVTYTIDHANNVFSRDRRSSNDSLVNERNQESESSKDNRINNSSPSLLGKRVRNAEDEDDLDASSLKRKDIVTIVQAAKANGVAVVIHQHNYHNHYHNYHYSNKEEMMEQENRNKASMMAGNSLGRSANNKGQGGMSYGPNYNSPNTHSNSSQQYPEELHTRSTSFGSNTSSNGGGNRGQTRAGTLNISNILNTTPGPSPSHKARSTVSPNMSSNGVPLLARGSVDLGIGNRLSESHRLCNSCGGNNTSHHTSRQNAENHTINGIKSNDHESYQSKNTYLPAHPHFQELEQIDMDTDPFGWIPPLANVNGNNLVSLSYDEIPFNPS